MPQLKILPFDGILNDVPEHRMASKDKQYLRKLENGICLKNKIRVFPGAHRLNSVKIAGKTVTNSGVTFSSSVKKIGSQSAVFDGSSYISLADSDDWYFNGDFTIDFFANPISLPTGTFAGFVGLQNANNDFFDIYIGSNGEVYLNIYDQVGGTQIYTAGTSAGNRLEIGTWKHVAVVKNGTSYKIYVNGVLGASTTSSVSSKNYTGDFYIGRCYVGGGLKYFNGYIDEFRISKGVSKWTSNFTPPTTPYQPDSYTKLLLHFEDNFTDDVIPQGDVKWLKRIYYKDGSSDKRYQFAVINRKIYRVDEGETYFEQMKISDSLDTQLEDFYPIDATIKVGEIVTTYLVDGKYFYKFSPNDAGQWERLPIKTDIDGNTIEPTFIYEYLDRLWVLTKNKNIVLFSKNLEPENFSDSTDAGFIDVSTGIGGYPQALALHRGFLYLFHESYFAPINGSSVSTFGIPPGNYIHGFGTRAPRSVISLRTQLGFLNSYDNEYYLTGGTLDSTLQSPLSEPIVFSQLMNPFKTDLTVAYHDVVENTIRISYVHTGEASLNAEEIYSLDEKKWCGQTRGRHISCYSQWIGAGDSKEMTTGRSDLGVVMIESNNDRTFDNAGIAFVLWTGSYLLSEDEDVQFEDFYLDVKASGNYTVPIDYYLDSRTSTYGDENINLQGELVGVFAIQVADQSVMLNRGIFDIDKSKGRMIRFQINFGRLDGEFELYGIYVNYNAGSKYYSKYLSGR